MRKNGPPDASKSITAKLARICLRSANVAATVGTQANQFVSAEGLRRPRVEARKKPPGREYSYTSSDCPVAVTTLAHSCAERRLRRTVAIGIGTWMKIPCCNPISMSVLPAMAA